MKTVNIGGKELELKASPLALLHYQQEFKKDLLAELMSFESLANMENGDYSSFDSVKLLRIVYVMNKTANFGKKFPDFEKWLSQFENIDFTGEWLLGAINEAQDGFLNSTGTSSG